ncbi:hypothetical protein ACFRR7_21500 [Streptomyces sp. NPDC056909]|uniref:hypothetical protein n=1 Tax=unclassified Streptomyces TaxID=2593676 RepID=UPI0036846954
MTTPPADNGNGVGDDDVPHVPRQPGEPEDSAGVPAPSAEEQNAATRYMCTGVRLYEGFARTVMNEMSRERIKARAPSYGVDLDQVREHAQDSLRDLRERDRYVAAAFLLSLVLAPAATVIYVLTAGVMGGGLQQRLPLKGRLPAGSAGHAYLTKPSDSVVTTLLSPLFFQLLMLVIACLIGQNVLWSVPNTVVSYLLSLVLLVGCPWYFTYRQRDAAWKVVREWLRPGSQLVGGEAADDTNLIVYSGFSPFVGAGVQASSWSFASRLIPKGATPGSAVKPPPVPFGSSELVERLSADLLELRAQSPVSSDGIAGMRVREKVFVHGSELLNTKLLRRAEIWPGRGVGAGRKRPTDQLPQKSVESVRGRIDGPVRHCLSVQIRSWGTDLVLTVFVQVAVNGGTLYLQTDTRVLPPVKEEFRVADSLSAVESDEERWRRMGDALLAAGSVSLTSVPHVIGELGAGRRLERWEEEQRWAIRHDARYDYGARLSLREVAASPNYRNFFQFVDVTRAGKQVELQVLGSVMNFLADHGLDTSDLDARRTTILNNGVMMYGGSVTGSIAAGAGAAATSTGLAGGGGGRGAGGGHGAAGPAGAAA